MAAPSDAERKPLLTALFAPTASASLEGRSETKTYLILTVLETVVAELRFWKYDKGRWALERTYKGEGLQATRAACVH